MDSHFSRESPLDGETRFYCEKIKIRVANYFVIFLKEKKEIKPLCDSLFR